MRKRALTSGRADDNEYTMRERLKTFHKHAEPVIDYFKKHQKLIEVDAEADAPAVYYRTIEGLKRMFLKRVAVVFVVGGPGCGKGTQCDRLKDAFRCKETRPDTRHKMRLVCVLFTFENNSGHTDQRTERPTDEATDGPTDGHDLI